MNKKILKNILLIIGFVFAIFLFSNSVEAAYISISLSSTTANPGDQITGTVTSDCVGRVNLSVSNGSISSDRVWIEGGAQSFTITVGTAGTTTVSASAEGGKMSDGGVDVDVSGASATVSVSSPSTGGGETTPPENPSSGSSDGNSSNNENPSTSGGSSSNGQTPTEPSTTPAEETKSNNTNLGNLGITPNDFTGFKPYVTEYTTTVPNDVTSINVYAVAQRGQTISGTGTKELQEGENVFQVVVTAEDGTTQKTYTITVNREKAEGEENPEEETPEEGATEASEGFGLSILAIEGVELSPRFSTDVYEYTAKYTGDASQLDITTTTTEEGTNVEITGNENLVEGENIITILVTDASGDKTVTYQITVQKQTVDEEALAKQEELERQQQTRTYIIIGGIAVLIIVVIIILVIRHIRNKRLVEEYSLPYSGLDENDDDYYDDNKDPYNNYDSNNDYEDNYDEEYGEADFKRLTQKLVKREEKNSESENIQKNEVKDSKQKIKDLYLNQYDNNDNIDDDLQTRRHSKGKRFK